MKKCRFSAKLLIAALVWIAAMLVPKEAGAATVRSEVSGGITWSIDDKGTLTLEGEGDHECSYDNGRGKLLPPWCEFSSKKP